MREGLAREFPEAMRAVAWTRAHFGRGVLLWGEPVVWATISGIGAGFLVSAVVQVLVGLTGLAFDALRSPMPLTLFPLVTIAGIAGGAAVALAAGGPLALALDIAYTAVGVALRIPGLLTYCERSGFGRNLRGGPDECTTAAFLTSLWPQLVGLGLGILAVRVITTRGTGVNSLLRVAGGYAIASFVAVELWSATVAQTATAQTSALTIAAGIVAAAVAAGVIAAQLPRGVRSATIVAGIWLLPWLVLQLPQALRNLGSAVPADNAAAFLVTLVIPPIAAAFMVLTAAVASRGRFIPRELT